MRIGPLAVDGSTTDPPCVMSTSPAATSRLAARRAGSISSRHPSPSPSNTSRAASDGQIVDVAARFDSRVRMLSSRALSTRVTLRLRHASLQYATSSQFFSHFARHSMRRPQDRQVFGSGGMLSVYSRRLETRSAAGAPPGG